MLESLHLGPHTKDYFEDLNTEYTTQFVIARDTGERVIVKEPHKCEMWRWFSWSHLQQLQPKLFKPINSLLQLGVTLNELKSHLNSGPTL